MPQNGKLLVTRSNVNKPEWIFSFSNKVSDPFKDKTQPLGYFIALINLHAVVVCDLSFTRHLTFRIISFWVHLLVANDIWFRRGNLSIEGKDKTPIVFTKALFRVSFCPLPDDKILAVYKFKAIADDLFYVAKTIVGKGKNGCPGCFQRAFPKSRHCAVKG